MYIANDDDYCSFVDICNGSHCSDASQMWIYISAPNFHSSQANVKIKNIFGYSFLGIIRFEDIQCIPLEN